MTYSLHTLTRTSPDTIVRTGLRRLPHEVLLILGALALLFWLIALLSYSAQDVAWSTSGSGEPRTTGAGAWVPGSQT